MALSTLLSKKCCNFSSIDFFFSLSSSFLLWCNPFLMNMVLKKGTNNTEMASERNNASIMVYGKVLKKSFAVPDIKNTKGRKVADIARVAVNTDGKSSLALLRAAFQTDCPSSSFSTWLSITTMGSSTTIPSTIIRAAKVTVFSSIPSININASVARMVIGMVAAATEATRKGKSSSVTIITPARAKPNSLRKWLME